jgi:DNA-binding NtrC family response regulator
MIRGVDQTDSSCYEGRSRGAVRFLVEEPEGAPRTVEVPRGRVLRIGRGDDQDLRLGDARSSRTHAMLAHEGDGVCVRDLGSRNGTWLGERRVVGVVALEPGVVLRIGGTRLTYLPREAPSPSLTDEVVAVDPASQRLFALVQRLAASDVTVLLQGETGVGKEVVARALHRGGPRARGPFVAINCGSLPDAIAESELFGHERGAFTGAHTRRVGAFERARGGLLLLDEVSELSPASQTRLLRVLQERAVLPVGASRELPVDLRVVAATNRDLAADVAAGRFREDLYYRLNVLTVVIPPLRDRPGDLLPLAEHTAARTGRSLRFDPDFLAALRRHRWPGNVRELRHAITAAAALAEGDELRAEHLPPAIAARVSGEGPRGEGLRDQRAEFERAAVVDALRRHRQNQSHAALELGISRRALIYKMERFGLKAPPRRKA